MEEDQELQNPFPSPPSHYTNYTSQNLALLSLLNSRVEESGQKLDDFDDAALMAKQLELLPNENLPDWPLAQLNKPRVDWILEEGVYNAFGDTWFTIEKMPSLEEQGVTQLYPSDPTVDRRPAMKSVLSTLLFTYSSFLSSIIAPPPPIGSNVPPDWHRLLEWMRIMGQNIMGAANDLRPVQARVNLEAMMTRQLELRRDETKSIHAKCDALEAKLAELRLQCISATNPEETLSKISTPKTTDISALFDEPSELLEMSISPSDRVDPLSSTTQSVTQEEVFRWAEEA